MSYGVRASLVRATIGFMLGTSAVVAAPQPQASIQYSFPAQPLADALRAVATRASLNVLFDPPLVADRTAPALQAELTTTEVLSLLLEGTGLAFEFVSDRTVAIRAAHDVAGEASADRWSSDLTPAGMRVAQESASASASAQAPAAPSSGESSQNATQKQAEVETIVVTAQKREERLQDVPVPVTVISGESLVSSNQVRLEDYYSRIPGLGLTSYSIFGSSVIAVRGLVSGRLGNPSVGVVFDDVAYGSSNNATFGFAVAEVDPSELAHIELLRGPQGTLYGASSIGGLLKYVTVDPSTDRFSGRVQAGMSSVENGDELGYSVRAAVNVPLSDTWAMRASGFTRRDPGYIDDPTHNDTATNWAQVSGGRLALLWRPSDNLSLKLGTLLQESDLHATPLITVGSGLGDLQQNLIPGTGISKDVQVYTAHLAAKLGSVDLASISAYSVVKNHFEFDLSAGLGFLSNLFFPGFTGAPSGQHTETKRFSQEVRVTVPLAQRIEWLLGGYYVDESGRNQQTVYAADFATGQRAGVWADFDIDAPFKEYAAFTTMRFNVTDRFDLQLGARAGEFKRTVTQSQAGNLFDLIGGAGTVSEDSRDSAVTYLVTPQLKVSPDLMLYMRLASGYRIGGPNLSAALGTPPEYGPDKSRSYEIGVKGNALDHLLSFDASIYHIDWDGIQVESAIPPGLSYIDNGGQAKSEGIELSVELRPWRRMTASAWVAYSDAALTEDMPLTSTVSGKEGDRLPFGARWSGNLSLEQGFPITATLQGFVGGSVVYVGDRTGSFPALGSDAIRRGEIYAEYTKVDLRAGVTTGSWEVNIIANNVTDKRAILAGDLRFSPNLDIIQPRTIGLSLTRNF